MPTPTYRTLAAIAIGFQLLAGCTGTLDTAGGPKGDDDAGRPPGADAGERARDGASATTGHDGGDGTSFGDDAGGMEPGRDAGPQPTERDAGSVVGRDAGMAVRTDAGVLVRPDAGPATGGLFPADRVIAWRSNVGVEGGIPSRTMTRDCVATDSVPTDGTSDATTAIQRCLDMAPTNGVALLRAGNYRITARIEIPSRKSLRGAGSVEDAARGLHATTIYTRSSLHELLYVGSGTTDGTLVPITAGATRGSTALTVSSASGIAAGSYVLANELNDTSIPVTPESYADGTCSWCDQFGATRLRAQVAKVTGVVGNTLQIAPAFFYDFAASRQPRVMKLDTPTEYAGIEDLVVKNDDSITGGWQINVMMEGAANSWMRNVRTQRCGKRCVDLRTYYYRIEIRDGWFEGCVDHTNSDTCYGTELAEGSSSLVENNVYHDTSNGPLVMWGASGNVIAYNYANAVFRFAQRDSWFWPSTWSHGAHPSYNLWEGNSLAGINWDGYWGSASHNTAFRNRLTGHDPVAGLVPGHVEVAALITESNNHYMSVVGNVLGDAGWSDAYEQIHTRYWSENLIYATGTGADAADPGCFDTTFRHMNYDFVTRGTKRCGTSGEPPCQGSDGSTALPASLYLDGRPAWFGDVAFPPFDPSTPDATDLPARRRFLAGG